jgi:hypothetical protein
MAKRGEKAAKVNAPTERDRQDIRRLLRKAGSREQLFKWINAESLPEDFDNANLPSLALMEEQLWKYQRSPEAKRIFKRRTLELGTQERLFTREEIVRMTVEAVWKSPRVAHDVLERQTIGRHPEGSSRAPHGGWRRHQGNALHRPVWLRSRQRPCCRG